MIWAIHIAQMGKKNPNKILIGNSQERRPLRRPSLDGRMLLI
jgi:hypothetical protein